MRYVLILLAGLLFAVSASAAVEVHSFDTPREQERYRKLIEELRCLVCQNQNLAESDADLAKDLRQEVYEKIEAGQSDQEIVDFMVARYGDFVLYRPPFKATTALLWVGPFLILGGGIVGLLVYVRRRRRQGTQVSAEELAKARQLLNRSEQSDQS